MTPARRWTIGLVLAFTRAALTALTNAETKYSKQPHVALKLETARTALNVAERALRWAIRDVLEARGGERNKRKRAA